MQKGKQKVSYSPAQKEKDARTGEHTQHVAPYWWEKEVFGKKGIVVCKRCHAIYFDKHWHSWQKVKNIADHLRNNKVIEKICFECQLLAKGGTKLKGGYEGEVVLSGLRNQEEKKEIIKLARNIGKRATLRDPEDQIISIEDRGRDVIILTTENQLAVSIGKQIDQARKGGKLEIIFSKQNEVVRVKWFAADPKK